MNLTLPQIKAMTAYCPPLEQREKFTGLRLDFNERQALLPPKVQQAITQFSTQRCLRYPAYGDFLNKLANYTGLKSDSLLITNGSDQGIELIFRTFVNTGDTVIIPAPSFAMFKQVAQVQNCKIVSPKYGPKGEFPLKAVLNLLKENPRLLVICNPNNPTGTLVSLKIIKKILKAASNTLVYIDEAYFEFSGVTAAQLCKDFPNLIITRTFSKAFGLAALRIGYLISCAPNIKSCLKVRGPYDINQLAKVAAEAALDSVAETTSYCKEVMGEAKPLVEDFFSKNNIEYLPSAANFLYFRDPFADFYKQLAKAGILIRPREPGYSRVTIGTSTQMELFCQTVQQLIRKS